MVLFALQQIQRERGTALETLLKVRLPKGRHTVGRAETADIQLPSSAVSKNHGHFEVSEKSPACAALNGVSTDFRFEAEIRSYRGLNWYLLQGKIPAIGPVGDTRELVTSGSLALNLDAFGTLCLAAEGVWLEKGSWSTRVEGPRSSARSGGRIQKVLSLEEAEFLDPSVDLVTMQGLDMRGIELDVNARYPARPGLFRVDLYCIPTGLVDDNAKEIFLFTSAYFLPEQSVIGQLCEGARCQTGRNFAIRTEQRCKE